jgi:hypothetical protein
MAARYISFMASIAVLGLALSVSAQQPPASARLVRVEGQVALGGQPVAAGAGATTLSDGANLQTMDGRAVIALKRAGTLVLGSNTSVRVHANGSYNFNRIEVLSGSAVLLSASNVGRVACGTEATVSSDGIVRFDVLAPERIDGSRRCQMRVYEGAASTPGASVQYVLRAGQQMIMNTRAGDMIPVNPLSTGALDDLDRWAREQAGR